MPDNKNNDVINDILNQLDAEKKRSEAESSKAAAAATDKAEEFTRVASTEMKEAVQEAVHKEAPRHIEASPVRKAAAPDRNEGAGRPARQAVHKPYQESDAPVRSAAGMKRANSQHHKKKKKKRRSRLPGVLILTVFIFAVSICLSMVIIAFGRDMFGIGKSDTTKLIIVPEGADSDQIAQLLYDEEIIRSPKCFRLFTKLRKENDIWLPGEHFVSPSMAYETIIDSLTNTAENEKKEAVDVTFVEGITLYDAAEELQESGVCKASDFIFYFNSGGFGYDFEDELPKTPNALKFADARMEGYLFPDTYTFTKDMDPEQVCQKIYYNFDQKMTDERLAKMKKLNLTLDQLITFASIVQKEGHDREQMDHIASVFWNRLRNPDEYPKLESDPTSNYSNDVIRAHMSVLNNEILNAYDTYIGTGLPPGAICNPGTDAIDAVLTDMKTDDYFFIANINTNETFFAKNNDEHELNKAKVAADMAEEERRRSEEDLAANSEG